MHAVLAMTVALREEAPDNVEVGLICSGLVRSELAKETETLRGAAPQAA